MSQNPEQPVLDAIAELVDWQLEEGRRRGDDRPEDVTGILAMVQEFQETVRQLRGPRVDRPNLDVPGLQEGDRVAYVTNDGTIRTDTVRRYREFPDADQWTLAHLPATRDPR